jgi:hypothetical protein
MTLDDIILGLIVGMFAIFGVTLFSVSVYTWLPRRPPAYPVARAGRPQLSDEPAGAHRRAF